MWIGFCRKKSPTYDKIIIITSVVPEEIVQTNNVSFVTTTPILETNESKIETLFFVNRRSARVIIQPLRIRIRITTIRIRIQLKSLKA